MFDFTEVIERRGYDPSVCRLLRHDQRGAVAWMKSRAHFGAFVSYQAADRSPYFGAEIALQFIAGPRLPDGDHSALFLAAHRILDRWPYGTEGRLPVLHHPDIDDEGGAACEVFDLEWLSDWDPLSERILIRWGSSSATRSWSQWPEKQRKEIVELRREAYEPSFPGFAEFSSDLDQLPLLPPSWRGALMAVRGVYLLVCPDTGAQYVGSAYGAGGFWERWSAYVTDGHGGNKLLAARQRVNYAVAILEVASPDMAPTEIIAREAAWKAKLGSRAHGLNAN